ncbi:MAG: hypothetical protein GDA51_10400 [Ekhidna sp.]|nr:hypothetical protein [Ekhidna sp.]MBC6410504.1 hypothetical protein [Ekhidna sp.]MBC6426855.1 hypothetical protein [Ekhidna sp.]
MKDADTLLVALLGLYSVEFLQGLGGVLLTFASLIYVVIKIIKALKDWRK